MSDVIPLKSNVPFPKPEGDMIWLPQEGEPGFWYGRFSVFKDLGPERTIAATCRVIHGDKHYSTGLYSEVSAASKKYHWHSRASAFDYHLQRIKDETTEDIVREVVENQTEATRRLTSITLERIKTMQPSELIDAADVLKAFETAVKVGSLVIGLPTERTESKSVQFTINMNEKNLGDDTIDAEYKEK